MGGKFTTSGTREKTIINLQAGPKAIEELTMDVLVPSLRQPIFHKWEMTHPWDQAKNQAECPWSESFHAASFTVSMFGTQFFKIV